MKVSSVDVHIVSVPYTFPEVWRFGTSWGLTNAIVEVHANEGITGIGEVPGSPLIALVRDALEATIPWIVGEDPFRVKEFLARAADRGWHHYPYLGNGATAAIEMALWDICGKALGCPVHQFFGGMQTEQVPFYWFVGAEGRKPETVRRQAAEGAERGFKTVYIKIGFDLENDLLLARALRDGRRRRRGSGRRERGVVGIRSGRRAAALRGRRRRVRRAADRHAQHRRPGGLARQVACADRSQSVRVATVAGAGRDRPASGRRDRHRSPPARWPRSVSHGGDDLRGAGIPICKHAFADLGVTTIATSHVLATLPSPQLGHQQFLTFLVHDLLATKVEFVDGAIPVPTGPGLGIELDRDALEFYKGIYQQYGEFEGYAVTPSRPCRPTCRFQIADARLSRWI